MVLTGQGSCAEYIFNYVKCAVLGWCCIIRTNAVSAIQQ